MKRVLTILAGWLAILTIHAENILRLSSVQGAPGEEVTVSVSLDNSDAVSAMQVEIPLDDDLTLVESSAMVASRASDHSATIGIKDGMLTLMVYSLQMTPLEGNSGEVASFKLKLGNQPKDITLTPSKVVLTKPVGTTVESSSENGRVSIRCAKASYSSMSVDFGRVAIRSSYSKTLTINNVGNEPLTVTGLAFLDPTFSCSTTLPFTVGAGSSKAIVVNYAPVERGNVETELYVTCNSISKLNTIKLTAAPYAVNELHVQPASGISDEEVTIHLTMNNMDDINGFQFEFTLPDALKYVDGSFELSDRKVDHTLLATLNSSVLRAISYSSSNSPFAGNDGEIASFKVRLNGQNGVNLNASKAVLTAQIKNQTIDVLSDKYGAYITIRSPRISTNTSLNMGRVPVTEECKSNLTIQNYGNAPLTISRVDFDNEAMSIAEEMPITIAEGSSRSITVEYNSIEEKDFSGIMQIYCNDPNNRLVNIRVSGNRFAPNYLEFAADDVFKLDNQSVNVVLDNYDGITGIQFDLAIPTVKSGKTQVPIYVPAETAYTPTESGNGISVEWRQIDEQTIRYFCYFLNGTGVGQGKSTILSLNFSPTDVLEMGSHTFTVSNVKLITEGLEDKYAGLGNYIPVTFNVIKKQQNIELTELPAMTYGDENFNLPLKTTDGQDLVWTSNNSNVALIEEGALSVVNSGTTVIHVTQSGNDLYEPFSKDYTLTVAKAPLSVIVQDVTITQGDEMPAFELTYEGFKKDDTKTTAFTKSPTATCQGTSTSPAGTYTITVSGGVAKNYELSYVNGTLTINPLPVIITANNITITYGDDIPELTYSVEGKILSGVPELSTNVTKTSNVGTYPIVVSNGSLTNSQIDCVNGTLTIQKAPLTVSVQDAEIEEGDEIPSYVLTYDGFKNGDTENTAFSSKVEVTTEATGDSPVGTYSISASGGVADNYELSYVEGTLTIKVVPVTITANDITITYGEEIPELTYSIEGRIVSGEPQLITNATNNSSVGTYSIVVSKGSLTNSQIDCVNGTLTIQKAPLTIGVQDIEIEEGEEIPSFVFTYEGFKNGDTEDTAFSSMVDVSTTATQNSPAGTYPITVSGGAADNYELNYVEGTLTLGAVPVTITANDITISYGDEIPELTYSVEGRILSGIPEISTEATNNSNAGTYPITVSKGSLTNSQVDCVNGTLTIQKVPLTISVQDVVIMQGESIPSFVLTYDGFKNGDTEENAFISNVEATTTATEKSPAGTYPITISGGEANNYDLIYIQGTLTIESPDGLGNIRILEENSTIYDLSGRKIENPVHKGFYIIDGKKVWIK